MSDLDSRALQQVNLFGQKFSSPGTVHYHLGPLGVKWPFETGHQTFIIEVAEADGSRQSTQHHVTVRFENGRHTPKPRELEIAQGDVVTWSAQSGSTPPFCVEGSGPGGAFSSAAMRHEAVYTHAFLVPGNYRWVDANGSKLSGEINVQPVTSDTAEDLRRWTESLHTPGLFHVRGDRVTPDLLQVSIGGTVCWAVEGTDGIAIADARLVPQRPATADDATS